jgi:hypothetical protein
MVTGWTADEWASPSPPQTPDTTIPQGVPCTRLANLVLAPRAEAKQLAADAQKYRAVPIEARADPVRPSDDAESTAPGGEKSTALSSPEPSAPQESTSTLTSPQADGPASAPPAPSPDASPTVASGNAHNSAVPIDPRADSVRPIADARAPDDAESIAPGGEIKYRTVNSGANRSTSRAMARCLTHSCCTAVGRVACRQSVGEQGLGVIP